MANPKSKQPTYADIEALPSNVVGEILFGSLETHPRPTPRHAAASSRIGAILGAPFDFGGDGPGGWAILDEPELHLGPHIVVPDLAGWKKEKLLGRTDTAWIDVVPDWICEVMSPATQTNDVGPKRRIYATYGVQYLWYIEPVTQTLEVFRWHDKDWLLLNTFVGGEAVRAEPFGAITFPLSLLWPFDKPIQPQEY